MGDQFGSVKFITQSKSVFKFVTCLHFCAVELQSECCGTGVVAATALKTGVVESESFE
jgi:hypothetical protein